MKNLNTLLALAASSSLCTIALGQSRQIPAPAQSKPMAILNARIHNPPASVDSSEERLIERGYVLFDEGRILDVGEGDPENLGENWVEFDASGLELYPGLIAGPTQLGLLETAQVRATDDRSETGAQHPEIQAWLAINPDSDLIPVARSSGIMTALVFPSTATIGAQPAAIRLDGWTTEDLAIKRSLGTIIEWPLMHVVQSNWVKRSESDQRRLANDRLKAINTFFDDAQTWLSARESDPTVPFNARFDAIAPVLRGEAPVFIDASRESQIRAAIAWAKRRNLKAVIVGGLGATACASLLAQNDVPVILRGTHRLPLNRHDRVDSIFTVPQALHAAGVLFSIGTDGSEPAHVRTLGHQAATAAAYGLPRAAALRAVTLSPAEIVGLGDQLGSIEPGKRATMILTTGDPLEITSETLVAFIDGRRIDLGDRQKEMAHKYREKLRQRRPASAPDEG